LQSALRSLCSLRGTALYALTRIRFFIYMNIDTPKSREIVLASIRPENAPTNHELLLKILDKEIEYRREDADWDYYENLYWCGFLLFCVGDTRDTKIMWDAKNINMDTSCGFDIQNLIGAGGSSRSDRRQFYLSHAASLDSGF